MDYSQVVKKLRLTFETGRTKKADFRATQLRNLIRMFEKHASDFIHALKKDLRKPEVESYMTELILITRDAKNALSKVRNLAKPNSLPKNLLSLSDKMYYDNQPHGVVLIIGTWNYPLFLLISPLISAIATGNCVFLKPSELSGHCSTLLGTLLPKYIDQECYQIIQGDAFETQKIMKQKFDFIFFTGSSVVGKIIYSQAASTLTPVCLELGGKSSVNMRMAAERIVWSKTLCLGQTCVSPDYIICSKGVEQQLIKEIVAVLKEFFGDDIQSSKDLGRIINTKHFARLKGYLDSSMGTVVVGGKMDEYDLFIEPTIVVGVDEKEPLMTEEIFGPILPIFFVKNFHDAIDFINGRPNPLALYVFSTKDAVIKAFLEKTNSGGVCINDAVYHLSVEKLPFGGLDQSGLGQYHGKFSFETFSRPRAVVHRSYSAFENRTNYVLRYPPHDVYSTKILLLGLLHFDKFYIPTRFIPYFLCFLLGLLVMYCFVQLFPIH